MKRILVVEDHPIMSAGTCQMIKKFVPDAEVKEVDTFWKALNAAGTERYDLVVMDIGIPGGNSVQMVEKFPNAAPIITPTAKSSTFPWAMNVLNSLNITLRDFNGCEISDVK